MKKGGCWIFLSHSSHDIEKVRIIRNQFEKRGQNPLAFHLRCLTTDTEEGRRELDSLIKREIDAREWFVFCESKEASQSPYVSMEKNYILDTGKKKIWSIDMSLPIADIINKVDEICRKIKVFISYSRKDSVVANALSEELISRDFDVWESNLIQAGESFMESIESAIKNAADGDFFVAFITKEYMKAFSCKRELQVAVNNTAKIIALIIGDCEIPRLLEQHHCYRIPHIPTKEDMILIADLIEADLKREIIGPVSIQAEAWNTLAKIHEKLNYENRYHAQEAVMVGNTGAADDYCEIYEFPCCGTKIIVGDGPVSRYRCDGCCKEEI